MYPKTSWNQLFEFRKDQVSVAKLRKLKLFLRESYTNKDKSFIEADLESRLTDYKNTVKDWGFETKASTFSLLLSSKSFTATAGGTLASVLFGAPTLAAVAAISGVCIEFGKISLHLANRRYGLLKRQRDHPLSYIIDAKKDLENDKTEKA